MSDGLTEQKVTAENDRERQARQVQERQQVSNNQAAWDAYGDGRIQRYLDSHHAGDDSTLPDALHEALGQILAEERRQWRRERALIEAEAQKMTADLRATIAELSNEIRQKALEAKPGAPDLSPDALHETLGQVLAEERRQWCRERELIQSEAQRVISDLRATISELAGEIRQKAMELKPGVPGVAGPPGPPGLPGKLPIAKLFEPGKVYYEGDVVIRDGSTYQALRDTGHGVAHADWICLAKAGRDGRDGLTPDVRGTYDVHERYARLDIVACGGAAFIAKRDNPGICPGDGWQMMSQQGRRGKPGQTGERGPRGEKGDTGPPAAQFLGARIDENFNLLRILSDGTKEVLPLRSAFERVYREILDQVES